MVAPLGNPNFENRTRGRVLVGFKIDNVNSIKLIAGGKPARTTPCSMLEIASLENEKED